MPFISQESILEVKRSADIQEIVASYFPLKRSGANYKACCPFHEEKTPSFMVHPEKQIFKCFGCQKGGDVLSFVMEIEKVEYPEAVRILAERVGVALKYEGGGAPVAGKEEVYKANEWAARLFRNLFRAHPDAEPARRYLAERGVNDETAERFQIGYAPDSWNFLLERAKKEGISEQTLLSAGLVLPRESGGYYDRFRGRLILPIFDPRGRGVGFGARTLGRDEPKYLNSPETPVFSKGRNLYGLHWIKDEIERTRTLYIVEGYLDVILPFQAGIRGLVATLGTALTRDHLRTLRRYADRVVLVYDGDAAGRKAAERGMELLLSENVDLFIVELPAGHDPADCVVRLGADKLRECLERPTEIFAYLLRTIAARFDLSTPGGKARAVEEILDRLATSPNEVKREILLKELARTFELEEGMVRRWMERRSVPGEDASARPVESPPAVERAARELLSALLFQPGHIFTVSRVFPADRYPSPETRRIASELYRRGEEGEVRVSDLMNGLETPEQRSLAADLALEEPKAPNVEDHIRGCMEALERHRFREERRVWREQESADGYLRKIEEERKRRPIDHGLLPGR